MAHFESQDRTRMALGYLNQIPDQDWERPSLSPHHHRTIRALSLLLLQLLHLVRDLIRRRSRRSGCQGQDNIYWRHPSDIALTSLTVLLLLRDYSVQPLLAPPSFLLPLLPSSLLPRQRPFLFLQQQFLSLRLYSH